eukprot:CAMPEP_0172520384 /NCGR_PEP_ID=MMETSP1066-20121228/291969_1 /TAXON_ID=671091 /ORGANISM="Coscinodiscus wailesii, Strain CCMP2513" /LENGTH=818 /DNA_ID=CAMNT_0013303131 /DNA_START=108 /DNA_END=2564 /DNA_ORIENTATION=-
MHSTAVVSSPPPPQSEKQESTDRSVVILTDDNSATDDAPDNNSGATIISSLDKLKLTASSSSHDGNDDNNVVVTTDNTPAPPPPARSSASSLTVPLSLEPLNSRVSSLLLSEIDFDFIDTLRHINDDDSSSGNSNSVNDTFGRELLAPHEYRGIFDDEIDDDDDDDDDDDNDKNNNSNAESIASPTNASSFSCGIDTKIDNSSNNVVINNEESGHDDSISSDQLLASISLPSSSLVLEEDIFSSLGLSLEGLTLQEQAVVEGSFDVAELLTRPLPPESPPLPNTSPTLIEEEPAFVLYPGNASNDNADADAVMMSDTIKLYESCFSPRKERCCLGHKETVFGLSFSPCGKYLATASQDSDIKVWSVADNKLVGNFGGHDHDYECLRVAWAPLEWGATLFRNIPLCRPVSSAPPAFIPKVPLLASAGANGTVYVWELRNPSQDGKFGSINSPLLTIHHRGDGDKDSPENTPQIYALQFLTSWRHYHHEPECTQAIRSIDNLLLTSANDCIHLYEIKDSVDTAMSELLTAERIMTFHFTSFDRGYAGVFVHIPAAQNTKESSNNNGGAKKVTQQGNVLVVDNQQQQQGHPQISDGTTSGHVFGGERNPDNIVYVFDVAFLSLATLLGVALSDGTVRLVNYRGVCVSLLQLPGTNAHLTSLAFDRTGRRLASVVATGHLILWRLEWDMGRRTYEGGVVMDGGDGQIIPHCEAVLQGGHQPGRPLFGAAYCGGEHEEFIISWGIDGRLVLWNSYSRGQVDAPLTILCSRPDYPIFALDILPSSPYENIARFAVGGGRDGGFLGIPVYLYDVTSTEEKNSVES